MKKKLSLSALVLVAALSLSACTGGPSPDPSVQPTITGPVITPEGKAAAEALRVFLVALDQEADTAAPATKYADISASYPSSSATVAAAIPQENAVKLYTAYTNNLKQVPSGKEITVAAEELVPDESGAVTIKSSSIRVEFEGKLRVVDAAGKDTFVLKNDNGAWKISDATIG